MTGHLLTDRELLLLCEFAERSWPLPLAEPHMATDHQAHLERTNEAVRTLTARGLADERGPRDFAADVVTALREGGRAYLVVGGSAPLAATVLRHTRTCCILVQHRNDVRVLRSTVDTLPDALLSLVPRVRAANAMPLLLPRKAVDAVKHLREEHVVERVLAEHGVNRATQQRWITTLHPVVSDGQFGSRPDDEVRWVDSGLGRLSLTESSGWISVNPLSERLLRRRFWEILHSCRADSDHPPGS
ncbi:ESX secretion-associated protein EspG [Actinosynnema sp. NPDC023658]|uniref:ESX secretion-associated protein EspG n=1 Tax=Actinosynnema sp. NPDC023658 TaxID=3155465 RepID=UPI0033EAB6DB